MRYVAFLVAVGSGLYCGIVTAGLAYAAPDLIIPPLVPVVVWAARIVLLVPATAWGLTLAFLGARLMVLRWWGGGTPPEPPTEQPKTTVHSAKHGAGPVVNGHLVSVFMPRTEPKAAPHDPARWRNAYELLCHVARVEGGSLAWRSTEPHITSPNARAYYNHMVKQELWNAGELERREKGEYFMVDWRATERRIRHGLVTLAPLPQREPPNITVYGADRTETRTRSDTVVVSPSGAVVRGVAG